MTIEPIRLRSAGMLYAAILLVVAPAADAATGGVLATEGDAASVSSCSACHGTRGEGQAGAGIPRLAGLDAAYLHAQLVAFGNGTRDNAVMSPIARTLDVATMAKAAAYYASLEAPPPPPPVRPTPQIAAGETLASRGDWKDAIPACASCHGARGLGVGAAFPPIAGQSATYVINQLNAWKSGARHDDPLGLMWAVAGRLTVSQIAAVAAYCETLPAASAPKPTGNGSTP